jgi:hypothetical protein
MSIHAVEKLLYEICNSGERAEQYRANPVALLARYPLTSEEQQLLRSLDVRGLMAYNVNPMLLMTTWNTLTGPDHIGEYLGKLNAPVTAAPTGGAHG